MEFWSPVCLSHVPSAIGKLKFTDSVTEDQIRLGFARVLVEVDVNYEFPREITLEDEDEKLISVSVGYPWPPVKCGNCSSFGYICLCKGGREGMVR